MKVTFLLADSAQAVDGKLYILGGGWSIAGPGPVPMALAVKLDVPWDQANQVHRLELSLRTADGDEPVSAPLGEQTLELKIVGVLEIGQPPDLPPGTDLDAVLAVNLAP